MNEHAQTSAFETKSNAKFDSICLLILHQKIFNGTCDALGVGDCYVIRFPCYHESKFILIEECVYFQMSTENLKNTICLIFAGMNGYEESALGK